MDFARFDKVTLNYKRSPVLSDLSFSVYEGEFFGIVGGGRSGKTTLLRAFLGILKPQRGEVVVHVRPGEAGTLLLEGGFVNLSDTPGVIRFGYVPQRDSIDEVFPFTVRDIVRMGRLAALGAFHRPTDHDDDVVLEKLQMVGLSENIDEPYRDLSNDQKQRVLIARALAVDARVMVLDEPVEGMNQENRRAMVKLLAELHSQNGITIIYATRRVEELSATTSRILLLKDGAGRVSKTEQAAAKSEAGPRENAVRTTQRGAS
jgi:ABC-type Mn2+/Zn2+ transport system ATPase subunit